MDKPTLGALPVSKIKSFREKDRKALHSYVQDLRGSGWSLREIGTAAGVSATTVAKWEKGETNNISYTVPIKPLLPTIARTSATPKTRLTVAQSAQLRRLSASASKVRRYTDANAQSRKDGAALSELLYNYRKDGVTLNDLAEACGVSRAAISQRVNTKEAS